MKRFLPKLKNVWGGIALFALVLILAIGNYKSDTILTGWDNLHPEFYPELSLKRSIFAVWQEYQGLGLLGGMGHASDLVRQIAVLGLSKLIPMELIRYAITFLHLFLGSLGAYFLVKQFLVPYLKAKKEAVAFLGGLFYLLNLGTIQTFYAPFEAFTAHYAALPWLLFGSLLFLRKQNTKTLAIFSLILLLATPSAYIPTLFVAYLIAFSVITGGLLAFTSKRLNLMLRTLKTFGVIFLVNAFWLLPFLYFTLTSSAVNVNAKMNQMATETIFLQNKEFGQVQDVIKLKGFWFGNVDPNLEGNFTYMLSTWRGHVDYLPVTIVLYALFAVIILGIIYAAKNKRPLHLSFLLLFLFSFTMLATDTAPFSWAVSVFHKVPLFGQAFRFPFTKFVSLTTLSFSLFFALGALSLMDFMERRITRKFTSFSLYIILAVAILYISYPAFTGKLIYEKEKLKLPTEYQQTFEFFKTQDPNSRIANLPQHTFWGWNFYKWGYGGSGFLWYGIKQPILDRAFDVWSKESENYYYEVSNALYAKDAQSLAQIFNKYHITWILVDKNVFSPFSPKAVFTDETEQLLSIMPNVKKEKEFGSISIYKVNLLRKGKNYLFSDSLLPSVNSYEWNNNDIAYKTLGNYKTVKTLAGDAERQDPLINFFPFRSLFSYRSQSVLEFVNEVKTDSVVFKSIIPASDSKSKLTLPSYGTSENLLPVELYREKRNGEIYISLRLLTPTVSIDNTTITKLASSLPVFIVPDGLSGIYSINSNGNATININTNEDFSKKTFLSLKQDNILSLTSLTTGDVQSNVVPSSYLIAVLNTLPKETDVEPSKKDRMITVAVPLVTDNYFGLIFKPSDLSQNGDCNSFRNGNISMSISKEEAKNLTLYAENDTVCASVHVKTLPHNLAYFIGIKAVNKKGRGLHFWAQNLDQKYAPVDTYLPEKNSYSNIILTPMEDFGQGYSLHLENVSIGREEVENIIEELKITPLPYRFLTDIKLEKQFVSRPNVLSFNSTHPNESLYVLTNLKAQNDKPATLILSQSYDPGWKAYKINYKFQILNFKFWQAFPFVFGKEIKPHIKVNNWENGWEVTEPNKLSNSRIILVYMPQYLEYSGFLLWGVLAAGILSRTLYHPLIRINRFFEAKANQLHKKLRT